jgi:hypothetical protein
MTSLPRFLPVLFVCAAAPGVIQAASAADWQRAYLYAYPLVLMDVTRELTAGAATNAFLHSRAFPTDAFRAVVRPNADTLYSSAWLDLSKEPILLRVPDTGGRYYLMQVLDAWTETIAVPGKRTTGTDAGWFAIAGPGWKGKLPAPVKQRIDSPTNIVWLLGRIQTNGAGDYPRVHKLQDAFRLTPLSRGRAETSRAKAAAPATANGNPPENVRRMSAAEFFARFRGLLPKNPPRADDGAMVELLSNLGPPDSEDAAKGVDAAKSMLASADRLRATMAGGSGWTAFNPNIGRYGVNYLARAVVARVALGANPPEDAVYLNCFKEPTGKPLEGAYRIHFEKSELPPVHAFWSITVYDADGYFIRNAAGRHAIGDRDPLRFNPDGSLDLYLQSEVPDGNRSNWLPTPASGPFNLSFRLYWPKREILDGKWTPPPVLRP